ncbi:TolC family protein [Comamonas thiooxydans]|uniref:TolC family protein n=1 Tax=Comamonas thiooxydans TaxID=363952 RepID=A0AA42TR50_9BURK|nr:MULTISPECIES: TolC family protein [Comamonas]MDH1333046.1 TolC family protein [Comamonas thiooxydans]MDH1742274.1 TolC family protein [Comamonas thiooxydans]MDH1788838.1 TolC family protein [Comamonas thiooxydans]TFF61313.1 TolC family protein [Comamonas sp. A23]
MTFITKAAAVLLGSGLGLFVPCAWAQQAAPTAATAAAPISLQAALALAMEHNPGLRAAAQALAASEGALIQSRARPNPELAYSQEDTRRETRSMTLQWNQSIEIGGKREARMKAAGHGRELARAELEAAQAGLRADVRTAFANVLAGQQRVQLHQRTLEIAGSARDAAAKRVLAGKVAPLEETKARVAESSAELALAQARSGLRVARQQLAALWGAQPAAFGSAVGELAQLPVLPDEGLMLEKLEHSPQMLRAQQAVFQARSVAELERAKRLPDPSVSLGMKRAQEVGRNQLVVGISVPLPILDSNRGNQLQALRLADKAEDELLATRQQMYAQLQQQREQLQSSRAQAEQLAQQVLPAAESAYEVAAKGFALGKFSYLEVLDAQRTLAEARSLYLEQLVATHQAAADITRQLGDVPGLE